MTQSLNFCTDISRYHFEQKTPTEEGQDYWSTPWFRAWLAKELLLHASENNKTELDWDTFKELSNLYAVADTGYLEIRPIADNLEKLRRLITIHRERRLWIEPVKTVMARVYLTLYSPPVKEYQQYQTGWDIEFRDLYGIDFPAFFWSALGIFFCVQKAGRFDRTKLTNTYDVELNKWFTDSNIDSVVSQFCCTIAEFRSLQTMVRAASPIQRLYELNQLRRKPLVRNVAGDVLIPLPMLISDRLCTGVYYDLIEKLNREGRNFRDFTTCYGKLFEGYVGHLLSEFYSLGNSLVSAEEYFGKNRRNRSICDWLIFEGNAVVLVECKAAKPPKSVLDQPNTIAFRDFFIERYLNHGLTQFEYASEFFAKEGREVYTLIVYNDYISLYNDYDLILYQRKEVADTLRRYRTAFASIYDFEKTLPLLSHVQLSDILQRKWDSDELRPQDLFDTAQKFPQQSDTKELETITQVWKEVFGEESINATRPRD